MRMRHAFPCLLLWFVPTLALAESSPDAAAAPASDTAAKPAAYVPKTPYDNTPYRFNAGKRFTAAEFDAWMKSRGIRVAKGKPAAEAAPTDSSGDGAASKGTETTADAQSVHCEGAGAGTC